MPKELEGDPVLAELGMPNTGLDLSVEDEAAEESPEEATAEAVEEAAPAVAAQAEDTAEESPSEKTTLEELSEALEQPRQDRTAELEREVSRLQGMLEAMVQQANQKVLETPDQKPEGDKQLEPYDLENPAVIDALAEVADDPKEQARRMVRLLNAHTKRLSEIEAQKVQKDLSAFKDSTQSREVAQAAEQRLQGTLDVLAEHGGKTGKELVQQFRQAGENRADTYIGKFLRQNPELLLVRNKDALALALQGAVSFLDKALDMQRGTRQPGVESPGVGGKPRRSDITKTPSSEEELDAEDRLLDAMLDFHKVPKEDKLLQELMNPTFE